ncbi:MAG: alpha/beta fold hydrolase [Armatimonadota bacterium]
MLRSLSLIAITSLTFFSQAQELPRRGALGLQMVPLTAEEAKANGMKAGVKAAGVLPGLTAEALKLEPGDILVSINKKPIQANTDVSAILRTLRAGELITVVTKRGKFVMTTTTKLIEKPKQKPDGFEVVYTHVVSNGNRIRVIATHPKGDGPFPTLFVIGGIGSYSMDGEFKAVPYGNILEPISKAGYAIVRTEKPGQGDSDGPAYTDLLFNDELDAYITSLRKVKTLPFVDKNRIAIFGHSMGGAFGPLVGAAESVAGIASCATMYKSWIEYNLENSRRQSALAGATGPEIEKQQVDLSKILHYTYNDQLLPAQIIKKYPALKAAVMDTYPDGKTYSGVGIKFFQQLSQKNLPEAWVKANTRVLSLWGDADFISTGWDQEEIANCVNAARPGYGEFRLLKNADHGFFQTTSFKDSMSKWGKPGNVHNPEVTSVLLEWLGRVLK